MTITIREYAHAGCFIRREEYGERGGLCWGVWRGGLLICTARTLRAAKRIAENAR